MSLAALYESSVLSALTDLLAYVQPPTLTGHSHAATSKANDSDSHAQRPARPSAPLVSVRWPSLPATPQQLLDALTLHDLLVLLIHAAVLQHGATPLLPQPTEQQASIAVPTQQPPAASHSPYSDFIPAGWNSSRSAYRLRYSFSAPFSHTTTSSAEHTSSDAEATADSPTVCEMRLLLLPMSHYLVVHASMRQVHTVEGANSDISANHKLTLDVLKYVSVDELCGCLTRWQERARASDEAGGDNTALQLSAWVYRDVTLLLTAVSNAIIKRCMGPLSAAHSHCLHSTASAPHSLRAAPLTSSARLSRTVCCVLCAVCSWTTFFAPNSVDDRFLSPSLPHLPVDLLLTVLLYLPSVQLARVSCVSSTLSAAASSPLLWQWLCSVELEMSDRSMVAKDDWKSEFVIRRARKREEMNRNRYALVPVGVPIDVRDDRRLGVGGVRGERPFFRLPFPLQPHALDDPLRFREWRRTGFGGWGSGGYRV